MYGGLRVGMFILAEMQTILEGQTLLVSQRSENEMVKEVGVNSTSTIWHSLAESPTPTPVTHTHHTHTYCWCGAMQVHVCR